MTGECYNMYVMTSAHPTLPLATRVRVKNLSNGRSIVVRINDRGPFLSNRLIDLFFADAKKLAIKSIVPVEIEVV
ncbi:septal ring lytic transglycosylase RlpA family protein [Legionella sainthelensi]|uniref:septal ring lytic transglycosylase RlpA family protein n=1 Tax=Legionella sainthelensi TaxID=28087 RepID=UPI001FD20339|nr:septal ring lytic transglycosylase RlpA family protein [Legionella sainthelensi]